MIQLAIGGGVTLIAGVGGAPSPVLSWWSSAEGSGGSLAMSPTGQEPQARSPRASTGFGLRGSALASLVFTFMIVGFLPLENALLYYGTLFMFGLEPTTTNAIVIYGLLTVAWIVLTTFGLKLVQRVSTILLAAFAVLTVVMVATALVQVRHLDRGRPGERSGGARVRERRRAVRRGAGHPRGFGRGVGTDGWGLRALRALDQGRRQPGDPRRTHYRGEPVRRARRMAAGRHPRLGVQLPRDPRG